MLNLMLLLAIPNAAEELRLQLDQDLDGVMTKVTNWRHYFHQYPELSNREFKTQKSIADALIEMGLEPDLSFGKTGVVAFIRGQKPGPLMALRADIDGLPVTEKLNLPFSSKEKTMYQGNEVGVMHACGHDAHIAILLGVASFLSQNTDKLSGDIFLIFQPAEEGAPEGEGGGAELMLAEGIFDRYKPEVIFGLHVTNSLHGHLGVLPGPAMAAASSYRITINGVQAHGSRPWDSVDPIMATAQLIESLNTVVSRRINIINNPAVLSVGMVKAGTRNNIIPEESMLMGTIRTFDPVLRKEIYDEIEQIAEGVAKGTGTKVKVEFDVGGFYPVTVNNPELVEKMSDSLKAASPGRFYESNIPVTGAEDFSYFSQEIPGLYFWLGVNKPGEGESANFGERTDVPGNHSPYFIVDDSALDKGVKALTYLVLDYPEKY